MIDVGIIGATGYTGAELLRLLARHPQVRVRIVTSRKEAGRPVAELFPALRGVCDRLFTEPDVEGLGACQAVFFATPHGTAMEMAPALLERGVKVIDLSADFRLRDRDLFRRWYGIEHTAPAVLEEAAYGLVEIERATIRSARLVACPGCYPTAVQLALVPLLEAGAIEPEGLIADCKSGVSGAGREAKIGSLFCEAGDSFKAYGASGHRHAPEIEQGLRRAAGQASASLTFVPHLTPMIRGLHATIYARLRQPETDVQAVLETRYRGEPFVDVMPQGSHPETRSVRGANTCRIAWHLAPDGRTLILLSVIDNLVKGASGQAVQCLNLMFGLPESSGLDAPALSP